MRNVLICLCLMAFTFAVYWPVQRFDFVNYDDGGYIYDNPSTLQGLTWENFLHAFRSTEEANYHPLIWISFALDVSLFGSGPRGFHLENVLIHAVNTAMLFLFLVLATGNVRPAVFCAVIFGVHPLHVESVAWISERKDTLSGLFFLLALLAYLRYVRAGAQAFKLLAYFAMSLLLILGLLAKSSLVTFPFVLLLFDYWPLHRIFAGPDAVRVKWRAVLLEKMSLLVFCAVGSVATYIAQRNGGAVASLASLPLSERLANAVLSYCRYLQKFFWPTGLCVFYPRIRNFSVEQLCLDCIVILMVTVLCLGLRRKAPFLIIGWFFFLGVLVPMIGLVQVGWQSIADRYMYLAMIGPSIMLAWSADALLHWMKPAMSFQVMSNFAAAALSVVLSLVTRHQLRYWQDTRTLFNHSIAVTGPNSIAHLQLGYLEAQLGNFDAARRHYQESIRIDPAYFVPDFDLANLFLRHGDPQQAIIFYHKAAENQPGLAKVENNWGIALLQTNRPREAFEHFQAAEQSDPDFADVHLNLGHLFLQAGKLDSAETEFQGALNLNPNQTGATEGLAAVHRARSRSTHE